MMMDDDNDISQDDITLYEKIEILLQHPVKTSTSSITSQHQAKQNQQQINNNDYYYQNEIYWIILLLLSHIENDQLFLQFWIQQQHRQYDNNNNSSISIIHWMIHWFNDDIDYNRNDNNGNDNNSNVGENVNEQQQRYQTTLNLKDNDNKQKTITKKVEHQQQKKDHDNNNYEWMIRLMTQLMDRLYRNIIIIITSQDQSIITGNNNNKNHSTKNHNNNNNNKDIIKINKDTYYNDALSLLFSSWNISIMNGLVRRISIQRHQQRHQQRSIDKIDVEIIMTIDSWYSTIFSFILSSSKKTNNNPENNVIIIQNKSKMDNSLNAIFCVLWNRYVSFMNNHSQNDVDIDLLKLQKDHLNDNNNNDPIMLMNLTLKTLLDQSTMIPNNDNNNNNNQIMNEEEMNTITTSNITHDDYDMMLQVLLQHSISYIHIYYKIPVVYEKILHWWLDSSSKHNNSSGISSSHQKQNKKNRQDYHDNEKMKWVKVILRLYQEYEKMIYNYNDNMKNQECKNNNTITSSSSSSSFLIDDKNSSMIIIERNQSNLLKLLMASIISTQTTAVVASASRTRTNNDNILKHNKNHDDITLRSMAWSSFVIIFQMNNNNHHHQQDNNLEDRNNNNNNNNSQFDNTSSTSILFSSSNEKNNNNNKLGQFRTICTVVRFAEGEWNIQINEFLRYLEHQKQKQQEQKKSSTMKECYELIDSCGQIMIETIQWIILMNDSNNTNNDNEHEVNDDEVVITTTSFVLRPDAVLHLHKSFESALSTTTECLLLLMTDYDNETLLHHDNRIHNIVIQTVIRVFGALLTELDIFELQLLQHRKGNHNNINNRIPSSKDGKNIIAYDDNDDDTDDLNEYIQALYVALKYSISMMETKDVDNKDTIDNEKSYSHLVGGLAMVFGSAEGDTERIQLLKKYHLLDNIFIQFVTTFWMKHHPSLLDNHQIIQWMCQIIELWMNMISSSSSTTTGVADDTNDNSNHDHRFIIANAIIKYLDYTNHHIKSNIQQFNKNNSNTTTSSLSMIIGCYVTLIRVDDPLNKNNNDNEIMSPPPKEPDATIIQQTLEIIQSLSG